MNRGRERTERLEYLGALREEQLDTLAETAMAIQRAVRTAAQHGVPKTEIAKATGLSRQRIHELLR